MVENNTGTLNRLTIDNSTIGGRTDNGTGMNDGINFQADTGSTAMNLTVTNTALTTARAALIAVTNQPSTNVDVVFDNNTLTNNHPLTVSGGPGLDFAGLGNMTFDISNNTFDMHAANGGTGIKSHVIEVNKGSGSGNSTFDGTIAGNTIGVAATAHSGSGLGSNDIDINSQDNGVFNVLIENNILTHYDTAGIQITQGPGGSTVNATVIGNTTSNADSNGFAGLYVVAGVGLATDHGVVNLKVGGTGAERNDFSNGDPANGSDVFLQQSTPGTSVFNLSKGASAASNRKPGHPGQQPQSRHDDRRDIRDHQPGEYHANPAAARGPGRRAGAVGELSARCTCRNPSSTGWLRRRSRNGRRRAYRTSSSQHCTPPPSAWPICRAASSARNQSPAHITIDTDAAGHGWFIDPTPLSNSEFTHARMRRAPTCSPIRPTRRPATSTS